MSNPYYAWRNHRGVTYGVGSTFVGVGDYGKIIKTTNAGSSWDNMTTGLSPYTAPSGSLSLRGVAYGNSTFVAVGQSGTILTSTNGTSWTTRTSGTTNALNGVTFGE